MDPKQRNVLLLVLAAVLVVGSVAISWTPSKTVTQGLDLQGGLSVILTAEETSGTAVTAADMNRAELIVRNRVDGLGVKEASIQRQGNESILVQIPGIKDSKEALDVLGSTGQLEFVDVASITDTAAVAAIAANADDVKIADGTYQPFMTGDVVTAANVGQGQTGQIEVSLTMNEAGTKTWAEYTATHVGKQVAIVLDGVIQSAPVVNEPIPNGQTAITGNFTAEEAKQLKTVLETGALPVSLKFSESRIVGPTLGQDSLRQALLASIIGLALVAIYVLVYYRGLGLLTVGALGMFGIVLIGIMAVMSRMNIFSLTLPGLAGAVLTVGMAADSSILILERFREEVAMGKTIRSAANSGSHHGMMTSLDADVVSLVSAVALYFIAVGPVKGFALTLILGIFVDIIVMVTFKRPALVLLGENVLTKAPGFWGIPKERVSETEAKGKKGGVVNG